MNLIFLMVVFLGMGWISVKRNDLILATYPALRSLQGVDFVHLHSRLEDACPYP